MPGARKDRVGLAHVLWAIPDPLKGSLRPQLLALTQNAQLHLAQRTMAGGAEGDRSSVLGVHF